VDVGNVVVNLVGDSDMNVDDNSSDQVHVAVAVNGVDYAGRRQGQRSPTTTRHLTAIIGADEKTTTVGDHTLDHVVGTRVSDRCDIASP
jgi:hypothetical protein